MTTEYEEIAYLVGNIYCWCLPSCRGFISAGDTLTIEPGSMFYMVQTIFSSAENGWPSLGSQASATNDLVIANV